MYMTPKEIREAFPDAAIGGGAVIGSDVRIGSGVRIGRDAWIGRGAVIESGAEIKKGAVICRGAVVERGAVVKRGAVIKSGAWIGSGVRIGRGGQIERGAVIGVNRKGVTQALVINGIGTTRRMTAHTSKDGLVIVISCLNGHRGATIEQARKAIADKYPDNHAYFVALELAQRWYDQLEYTNTN